MTHHGSPAALRPGEVPDLGRRRIVACCTDADPPAGDLITLGWEKVDCPACLKTRDLGPPSRLLLDPAKPL
jgi:hypothetical protein